MKNLLKTNANYVILLITIFLTVSCGKDDLPVSNNVTLSFNNVFKNTTIVLGDDAVFATTNLSVEGQTHHFSELKYVISNIRLVKVTGDEIPYHIHDLDKGAAVIDQAKETSLRYVLNNIPSGEYKQIKFGLGVRTALNTLDQERFPHFYNLAGANDTKMMWEWGSGYRFTKIEGYYGADKKVLSIHTGSTVEGSEGNYTQGVDAYRDITLDLSSTAVVGTASPIIRIKADFDKLLSGKINTIILSTGTGMNNNATPNIHTALQMLKFVDNLGGNGTSDLSGMFSVEEVKN